MKIIGNRSAILVEKPVRSLIISDVHFGFEAELASKGIKIPSQTMKLKDLLIELVEDVGAESIIFLGDLKHMIPLSSWIEWREMPLALKELDDLGLKLVLVLGNHDGNIEEILGDKVHYVDSKGMLLRAERKIYLLHGHTWPRPEVINADLIIMGHLHPLISLRTEVGVIVKRKVWLHLTGSRKILSEKLGVDDGGRGKIGLIVMPAFNPLLPGISVNSLPPREKLWPLIRSGAFDLDLAEAITLGGENLGNIRMLRSLLMGEDWP